jgi:serine/threonine-protein kinase HipA
MQSLCGLAHYDFNLAGAYSYEQALQVIRHGLGLPVGAAEEQFRRMVFNVVARNQDDHTKNIAFLMGSDGRWQLSPAFDMTFAYGRAWTATHQMTINAKRDGLLLEDLRAVASVASMKPTRVGAIVAEVRDAVGRWPEFADAAGVSEERAAEIGAVHRLALA